MNGQDGAVHPQVRKQQSGGRALDRYYAKIAGDGTETNPGIKKPGDAFAPSGFLSKTVVPRYEEVCLNNDQYNALSTLMPEYWFGTSR